MQHVKKQWLSLFAYCLVGLDLLLFIIFLSFNWLDVDLGTQERWGITLPILVIAGIHALYILFIFPLLRRSFEWLATIISISIYAILFAGIIDTSGNTNLVYRLGYAVLVFCMAMSGPFAPLATVVLTWLIMLFTYTNLITPTKASPLFNIVINLVVTAAALLGWLFFRRYYLKQRDAETITLAKLLQQEQFKTGVMLEAITDGVMIINTKGAVQVLNESAAQMLGWNKQEALKLDYRSLVKPVLPEGENEKAAVESAITTTLQTAKAAQGISLLGTRHNRQLYVDIVASPILENRSDPTTGAKSEATMVGVIAVLRDVDKQQRQEQQRSEFISTASHEMRTPVAAIQGFLELALNPKVCTVDAKAQQYLEKAHESTKHLGELFQDLLTVSKSEDGKLNNHPQILNIHDFLTEIFEQEKVAAEEKGLKVVLDEGSASRNVAPLMHVMADPERLREVVLNLFENAIKYTKQGLITLGASLREQSVVIRVADTGPGIAEEDLPHIFQKFYRVDNSDTREVGGTGLGLYISKQLIEAMHGRIWVESSVGVGSTFYIELPRVNPEAATTSDAPLNVIS